jgi:archaemetzincin
MPVTSWAPRRVVFVATCALADLLGVAGCRHALELDHVVDVSRATEVAPTANQLRQLVVRLRVAHKPPDTPPPGSWLEDVHEPGQTFEQYLGENPTRPSAARRAIYVLPIGELDATRREILARNAQYLSIFFCLPVRVARPIEDRRIAWRAHPRRGFRQLDAEQLLGVLRPLVPDDALHLMGVTAVDLYPRAHWRAVYGLALRERRVGVWSLYRMGTPIAGHPASQRTALLRSLKIATHEAAHMLSIRHCTRHRCNMGGMNYTGDLDRRPVELCPECVAKVLWATGCDPVTRYTRLERFCRAHGLVAEARRFAALGSLAAAK